MQKVTILLLLFTLLHTTKAETIEKTYYFSNPVISQHSGYQQVSFKDDMLTAKAGDPSLPYSSVSLLMPPGHVAVDIEFIGENIVELIGNFHLWPYQPSRPLSDNSKARFFKNEKIYSSTDTYPISQYSEISTHFMNGYGFGFSTFTPVQYNPAEGKISYFSKVTIRITTVPGQQASVALRNLSSKQDVKKKLKLLAQNPEAINSYPSKSIRSDDLYELLILTPQQFENDFDILKQMYLSRGITSKVITKEYIQQNIEGQDLPEKIRNFIIQEYQESEIEYVLLGGDVEHIPYRGFYCYVVSGSGYESDDIPADLYYSALDGNWNDDGDNKWGEPEEDDLLPDIAVARFPFSNSTELSNLLNKTISYQNSPVLGEFQKPLLAGEHLYDNPQTWGKDYLDLLIGERDDNGYTTIGIPEEYDIETMYEYDASWTGSDLINKINQGKQFVHHVGHANETYVAHLSNSDITDANFSDVNGIDHNFTIMQTHGCTCGAFDYNDCILEKMVNIQNFAVAVVGNSRYGWFNEGQTEGPAAHLHREMVDAMFYEQIAQIGKAFVESKIQTAPWVEAEGQHEEGALRWNFYDINVLGDPAMSVWNDEPTDIEVNYPTEIAIGTPSVNVTVTSEGSPLENYSCAILKNEELCSAALTDEYGLAIIVFDPPVTEVGAASLIVSGYNCLPDTNEILFIPSEGAYVVYGQNQVDDQNGNNNGLIDYGEAIMLDVSLENVGVVAAVGVDVDLSADNTWISLTDDHENYGDIEAGETVMRSQAFAFDVADDIPDQTILDFAMNITDGDQTWLSGFQLIANAPKLNAGDIIVDDYSGNDNGIPDPGETISFVVEVSNDGHSNCFNAVSSLSCESPYISFDNNTFEIGDLVIGENIEMFFTATIDEYAPIGTPLELQLETTTGAYAFNDSYFLTIGITMEDFETGDFTAFEWINSGDAPWVIISDAPFEGEFSAKSGEITDNENSDLMISFETMGEGEISFYRKVSSEENWDFLKFYIGNTVLGEWSGEADWEQFIYPVAAGPHTLKWTYVKDQNTSNGSDCAWLDNIVFPATTTIIDINEIAGNDNLIIYPNPSDGIIYLNSTILQKASVVKVYDMDGRILYNKELHRMEGILKLDLNHSGAGLYFVKIQSENGVVVKKLVIR